MWPCVCLVLLVQGTRISSLPIQEELSTAIQEVQSAIQDVQSDIPAASPSPTNSTERTRPVRQLDFTECCPCPKNNKDVSPEVLEALPSNAVGTTVLPKGSARDVLPDDDDSVDGCSCELRNADAATAAAEDLPRKVSTLRSAIRRPNGAASEDPSILKPEVGLASSVLETLREATDEEYRDAVARDAERNAARSRNAEAEGNNNVVNIIVTPVEDTALGEEDEALTKASNDQNSRRALSPLGSIARKNKPITGLIKELFDLPSARNLKDSKSSKSQVNEKLSARQGEQNEPKIMDQNPIVKQRNDPANINDMDSSSAASSNIETFTPNQQKSNVEVQSNPLGRSSMSDDFLNLKNVKDLVGEREIKLKVPYLKVPSLINKDASTRNTGAGRKMPTLSELLEDIISPVDDVRPNQESVNRPQAKEEPKKVTSDVKENDDDDDDNKKFKTRILDSLPNSSQIDDTNNIPSDSFTPNLPVQPVPERENVEDDVSSQESDDYPNDTEGAHSMPNPMFVQPMSPVFIPEERSSNEVDTIETFSDVIPQSKGNAIKSESNRGAILERLDKLSKISNDLEKIKDLVEDMSKSKLETNQPKSADSDSDTGASERHENISLLPHKVLQAPQTLSDHLKKIGDKLRSNNKGMLGASSDRIQSLTFPRLSDLTAKPFDVFNLMQPQDKIVQPFIDPGKLLPWDLNNLRARAVPELPSVDEIRDRISDFIGRSGLGISALDMDDDSNTLYPRVALGKPKTNQQTELVDLDVFRLRPLKMSPSSKSRSQQPVQGFNLEKFKAKVQVPTKSVKTVELQSSFGKDGKIVGGRFSLQPPNEAFWDKVRSTKTPNTSNISKKQSPNSLKSDLKTHTDNILGSVKSNAPSLLLGGVRPQTSLTPLQKTSASVMNEVRKRVDNVLGASNFDQKDLNLKDSLLERKATIENRLQEIHSGLIQQISNIEPVTLNTHTNLLGARNSNQKDLSLRDSLLEHKATIENKLQEIHSDLVQHISDIDPLNTINKHAKLGQSHIQTDRFELDTKQKPNKKSTKRPKSNIELREPNVNNAKSRQSISKKTNANKRVKDADFSPSDSIAIKTLPDKSSLKRVNFKDDMRSKSTLKHIGKISSNADQFKRKDNSDTNSKSSLPLLRSVLKRKNLDSIETGDSSTASSIPSLRNLMNKSHKVTQNINLPESVILRGSQPNEDVDANGKISNAVFEKFNEKLQSRLTDIDARAKEILQSSKVVLPEEPQLGASESQKRFSLARLSPIKQDDKENIRKQDSNIRESSSASGPSWQKLTERIQSRLSEADAAVKKSLEQSNQKQRSKLHENSSNDMTEGASETETKRLNSPGSSIASTNGPSLQKLAERIQSRFSKADAAVKKSSEHSNPKQGSKVHDNTHDMNVGASETETKRLNSPERPLHNLKSKLADANEAFRQALQNSKFAKDSESALPSEARAKSQSSESNDRPLAKLTERLQGRLSGPAAKNIMHSSKDNQPSQSQVQEAHENSDSKRQSQDTLLPKSVFGEKLSKLLHNPKLSHESDLEQRASEIHDLSGNKESSIKTDALPLDKLREKLQSRFADTNKALKSGLKGPVIVQPSQGGRSVENIEDFGTDTITPLKNSRPLLDKITERMQNHNTGRNKFVSAEIVEPKLSRDSSVDTHSSNVMKVPLLERLAGNHKHPSLSPTSQPILGAAPKQLWDQNEGASDVFESTLRTGTDRDVPTRPMSPLLSRLTEKLQSRKVHVDSREDKSSSSAEDELIPNASDKVQFASRNSNKPMKQNVTYRCRMVCEEVADKK